MPASAPDHAYDIHGMKQDIATDLAFIIAGTSCKDASRLSARYHAGGKEAVESKDSSMTTPSTFHSLTAVRKTTKARRVFQENVDSVKAVSKKTIFQISEVCERTGTRSRALLLMLTCRK